MQQIVAAVDFSPVSERIVDLAADLAEQYGAGLCLLHVAAPDPDFVGYAAGPQTVREQRAAELRGEHRGLQQRAAQLRERGIDASARLLQGADVATIVAEAKRLDAGLIAVGSHGHGALHRLVLGSVSEGVVRHAPCPVLVVPATDVG